MATYTELFDLKNDSTLRNRIASACAIQAEVIRNETPGVTNHLNRLVWAKQAFANPERKAEEMMWALLAANAAQTTSAILAATDSAILAAVAAAVDIFATQAE